MNTQPFTGMPGDMNAPRRVAVVMSNAMGDTLVLMVVVQNLLKNGIDVTVFGHSAYAFRHWFPSVVIYPQPSEAESKALLAPYDMVLQMHRDRPLRHFRKVHPRAVDLDEIVFGDWPGCMAERFANFCSNELGLSDVGLDNGITLPPTLRHRRYIRRIAIHPEASTEDKRWLPGRFVKLARRLRARGYDVNFVIAPHERDRWHELEERDIPAPEFETPHELACWLFQSGWFIGNDSGVGHLASNLNIPTISLFRRRRASERWRPAWGSVNVVLPWQWVPTARLKEKFWRQTLTCSRVMSAFQRMVRDHGV
jgi:heptosyltransferase-3